MDQFPGLEKYGWEPLPFKVAISSGPKKIFSHVGYVTLAWMKEKDRLYFLIIRIVNITKPLPYALQEITINKIVSSYQGKTHFYDRVCYNMISKENDGYI